MTLLKITNYMINQQTNIGLAKYMVCTRVNSKEIFWMENVELIKKQLGISRSKKKGNIQMSLQEMGGVFVD